MAIQTLVKMKILPFGDQPFYFGKKRFLTFTRTSTLHGIMYRFQVTQQEVNMCPSSSKDWHKKRYVAKEPPPQARRATTKAEFCLMQTLLKDEEVSFEAKYGIRAFNNYQFHMIGRVDDCTQLQLESVQSNQNFPSFAIKTKLNWSKNVLEEQDSP